MKENVSVLHAGAQGCACHSWRGENVSGKASDHEWWAKVYVSVLAQRLCESVRQKGEHRAMTVTHENANDHHGLRVCVPHVSVLLHGSASGHVNANGCARPARNTISKQASLAKHATHMVMVSSHCEHSKQINAQTERADQEQLICVHVWGLQTTEG